MRKQNNADIELGRFISLILRHKPEAVGIKLDSNGWANVDELISGINKAGKKIDMEILERIVRENNKQRYSFNETHTKIRANQGHSINVDVELKEAIPPDKLYHGTATRFMESIKKNGITKQSRQYVHLSADKETATAVGKRHGKPIVLIVDTVKMRADGHKFYISENGVWLCGDISWKYISEE
jgi:putative RNA 2'-phosphotransferase